MKRSPTSTFHEAALVAASMRVHEDLIFIAPASDMPPVLRVGTEASSLATGRTPGKEG